MKGVPFILALLASFGGVFLFLSGFHEDLGDDFSGFAGADGAGGLLLGRTGDEAVVEHAAAGGAMMGAEGVVYLLGELLAEFRVFAHGFTAKENASGHNGAGERAAGAARAAHAATKTRCGPHEAVGAFFATAGEQGFENGFSAIKAFITVGFFCRLAGNGRKLFGKGHMSSHMFWVALRSSRS